jgi:hypothetical protein
MFAGLDCCLKATLPARADGTEAAFSPPSHFAVLLTVVIHSNFGARALIHE